MGKEQSCAWSAPESLAEVDNEPESRDEETDQKQAEKRQEKETKKKEHADQKKQEDKVLQAAEDAMAKKIGAMDLLQMHLPAAKVLADDAAFATFSKMPPQRWDWSHGC